uniref:Ciliary microtubule associated protein 1A n=1 Tax=Chelonoidis abingdonii TaxID=106734 RepID=A0A8C0FZB4_CHEAB
MGDSAWVGTWRPHRPRGPIMAHFTSPGPKYSIQGTTGYLKHNPTKRKAPAYTFKGARPSLREACPGAYTIPRVMGPNTVDKTASPCYSMKWKSKLGRFDEDLHKITLTKPCAPVVTFGIRHSEYTMPLIVDVY